jgi:integrase
MALTDTRLRALKPQAKRYERNDRDGLLIEVQPSGHMTWRYRYTVNGRRERMTIGPYPAISLAESRRLRLEAEALVARGISPAREKKRQKHLGDVATMTDLAERWIAEVLRPAAKKSSSQAETYLRRDCLPRIGHFSPAEVTTLDIRRCVDAVLARGHGQAARKVRDVLKRVFEFGEGLGIVRGNPAVVIRPAHVAPARSRSRTLQPGEIRPFLDAIYQSSISRPLKLAFHLLVLVPARKGELIAARREHFDLDAGRWTIPCETSKTGAPLTHELPSQALVLVRELLGLSQTEWLLPSTRRYGLNHISKGTLNQALRTVEGLPEGIVTHDLRRTVRTGLGELGVPEAVAELCLNHRPRGVAGIYDRSERIAERGRALQRWADYVDTLRTIQTHNVVSMFRNATSA